MADGAPGRRDEDGVRRFVEHFAMILNDWGVPRMPGRVLMALMSADEDSLTAAELGERLGVSPAAISNGVRYLMQIGIITRQPVHGSRRDRYRLPNDAWYEATLVKTAMLKTLSDIAGEGVAALGGTESRSGARLAEMRDFFRFFEAELPVLLEKWRAAKGTWGREEAAAPGRYS
jgi:predicted transcriptional regulator